MFDKWGNSWYEKIDTGEEAKAEYQQLFGTAYLPGKSTLLASFLNYYEAGIEGKRQYVMSGKDDNGNSTKIGAIYWARP